MRPVLELIAVSLFVIRHAGCRAGAQKVVDDLLSAGRADGLRVELQPICGVFDMANAHDDPIVRLCDDS